MVRVKVFVSYRRGDTGGRAGRLADALASRFGRRQVFQDVTAVAPGAPFDEQVDQATRSSDVVLVVIGRAWADEPDGRLGVVTMQDPDGAEILLEVADEIDIPFVAA